MSRQPLVVIFFYFCAAAAAKTSSYNIEALSSGTRARLARTHCGPGTICIGGGCIWRKPRRSSDGTLWTATQRGSFNPRSCAGCTCRAITWPIDDTCRVTIIPTRKPWVRGKRSNLGMGSRVSTMLDIAAFALSNGFGFQMSSRSCTVFSRVKTPHCFFQPVSSCGAHVCYEYNANDTCEGVKIIPQQFSSNSAAIPQKPFVPRHIDQLLHEPFARHEDALYQAYKNSCLIISSARECESPLFAQRVVANITLQIQPHIRKLIDDLIFSLPMH